MSGSWIFNTVAGALLLPPLNIILLLMVGLFLSRNRPRIGTALTLFSLLLFIALSTGFVAQQLAKPLEEMNRPLASLQQLDAQAIVVLGGGRLTNAPEYGGQDVPNATTLMRLRYAARLQRETNLPVLVSGGKPDGGGESEALAMAKVLREEYNLPVDWVEDKSDNTAQNALYSARMLRTAGIQKILLVTDAVHMPRAKRAFEQNGMHVLAAPTAFASHERSTILQVVPNMKALRLSRDALHEWIGMLWYRLKEQRAAMLGQNS